MQHRRESGVPAISQPAGCRGPNRFYARNPFTGQFPAYYEKSPRGRCTVHLGPSADSHLEIPVQARAASAGMSGR